MLKKFLIATYCLLAPGLAIASPLEIARLAQQLEYASSNLAGGAVGVSWSGSVKHNARILSQKAQKLQNSVERGRSSAYIRTRFTDVTRYYQRLEASVIRSMDSSGTGRLRNEFLQLSALFEDLRYEFYGDTYYQSLRSSPPSYPYTYPQPLPGDRYSPGAGIGVIVVPRASDYSRYRRGQHRAPVSDRQSRRDNDYQLRRNNDYQYRSPVMERQDRNDRLRGLTGERDPGRQAGADRNGRQTADQGYYRLRP